MFCAVRDTTTPFGFCLQLQQLTAVQQIYWVGTCYHSVEKSEVSWFTQVIKVKVIKPET